MSDFPAYIAQGHDQSRVEEYAVSTTTNENLLVGDLAVWDAGNDWIERAGADPTAIMGISEVRSADARTLTPNNKIPLRELTAGVVVAMSSATAYVEGTHRNVEYGITRSSAGNWRVDVSKTGGSARVRVVRGEVSQDQNIWYVQFLAEYLATDGIDS